MAEDSPVPGPARSPDLLIPTGQGAGNTTSHDAAFTAPGSVPAAAYPLDHGVPGLTWDAGHRDGGIVAGEHDGEAAGAWQNVEGRPWK